MHQLKDEFDFYLAHQDSFVEKYNGKVIVLKNHEVIGVYQSKAEAFAEVAQEHEKGTFLIQGVSEGDREYTAAFRSRVLPVQW